MEKKGYREPIKASLEEILERHAQINEIMERFDKLKKDIAKSSNPDDLVKIESEFKEYLKSLGSEYEVAISLCWILKHMQILVYVQLDLYSI